MTYDLGYHPQVIARDLKTLSAEVGRRITTAVDKRLKTAPERAGVPLKGSLQGCWKLRVGDYRVVYAVRGSSVVILAILHRREVYERAERRL